VEDPSLSTTPIKATQRKKVTKSKTVSSGYVKKKPVGKAKHSTAPDPVAGVKSPWRKPVIYLFSPRDVDASVSVSLTPGMHFTVIYPIVPIEKHHSISQRVQWNVRTCLDGTLTESQTGLQLSSLFWEAE
jgi:hypothetical protein